jgi:large conductance mechanosensitive channel
VVRKPDFSAFSFELNGAKFLYGDFLNATISFLLIAAAVYFFVVLPVNSLLSRIQKQAPPDKKKCPECRSSIALDARRCAFCTTAVS